jgi:hypothetical protein
MVMRNPGLLAAKPRDKRRFIYIPAFTKAPDDKEGKLLRRCTERWKIAVNILVGKTTNE